MFLDEQLAYKFIEKIARRTPYNVNIMNEQGIIIAASRDASRIGEFHEIAYRMLTNSQSEGIVSRNSAGLNGTHAGVNFLVKNGEKNVGVCGVTGDPAKIYDIGIIIKMALETMLEYESQHAMLEARKNTKLRFMRALLYHEGLTPSTDISTLARQLGYSSDLCRIPVLISFSDKTNNLDSYLARIKNSPFHSSQDISAAVNDHLLLIFKSFSEEGEALFSQYRFLLGQYLSDFLQYMRVSETDYHIYVGTFQNDFMDYHTGFWHCQWLIQYIKNPEKHSFYFYDYIHEYFMSQISLTNLSKIFHVIDESLPEDIRDTICHSVPSLERHNYNMTASSKELYIHKNTLAFRMNKIKNWLSLDPFKNSADRNFLSYLSDYMKNR